MHGVRGHGGGLRILPQPEVSPSKAGQRMVRFLASVADIRRAKLLYFGNVRPAPVTVPHPPDVPEFMATVSGRVRRRPTTSTVVLRIWAGRRVFRTRETGSPPGGPLAHGRAALLELLARLKPEGRTNRS